MSDGWIRIHRQLKDWRWYKKPEMVLLWVELLLRANHEPGDFENVRLNRGQCAVGRKSLSESTGLSEQTVRSCLGRLKSTNEITIKSTSRFSIITILNYSLYQRQKEETNQGINQQVNQQLTSNQPATNHKQELNNLRIKESIDTQKPRKARKQLSDWEPPSDEELQSLYSQYGKLDTDFELEKCKDHFKSKGEKKADWAATRRNWMKSPYRQHRQVNLPMAQGARPQPRTKYEKSMAAIDEWLKTGEDEDEQETDSINSGSVIKRIPQ